MSRFGYDRRAAGEALHAIIGLPLAVAGVWYLFASFGVGMLLLVTFVGLPVIALALTVARWFARVDRRLAGALLGVRVQSPPPREREPGLFGWLRSRLTDGVAWRWVAFRFLSLPGRFAAMLTAAFFWVEGLALFFYPLLWWLTEPENTDSHGRVHRSALQFGEFYFDTWPKAFLVTLMGAAALLLAPWAVRLAQLPERVLVRWLLGPTEKSERVEHLERTRARAVDDSAAELRRIERDLHDGAQARLVALAMNLGMIKEELAPDQAAAGADLDRARTLVDTAHRTAKEALVELREVARGIHPPVLDSGLDPALATLASRSPVPVDLRVDLPERPTPAIETIAYFCVAELLSNVAKHSRAEVSYVRVLGRDGGLRIEVSDNGAGGAQVGAGSLNGGGLTGLTERVRTVDGRLFVHSPPGGPTQVTVDLPLHS